MITADTITAEQIRALRSDVLLRGDRRGDAETIATCDRALGAVALQDMDTRIAAQFRARARCAEILNARARAA